MPLSKDYKPDYVGRRFLGLQDNVNVRMNQTVTDVLSKELSTSNCPRFEAEQKKRLAQLYYWPPKWATEHPEVQNTLQRTWRADDDRMPATVAGDAGCRLDVTIDDIRWTDAGDAQRRDDEESCRTATPLSRSLPSTRTAEGSTSWSAGQVSRPNSLRPAGTASAPQLPSWERRPFKPERPKSNGRPSLERFYNFDLMHKRPLRPPRPLSSQRVPAFGPTGPGGTSGLASGLGGRSAASPP